MVMRNLLLLAPIALVAMVGCSASGSSAMEQQPPSTPGEALYKSQCVMCHGRKGDLGLSGAKDLAKSTLTEEGMNAVVTNGKGAMAGFGNTLSAEQIKEVVVHVRSLRADEVDG